MSELSDKIKARLKEYQFNYQTEEISKHVAEILENDLAINDKPDLYNKLYSCLELETISSSQTISYLEKQLSNINKLPENAPDIAAIVCAPFYCRDFTEALNDASTATCALIGSSLPNFIEVTVAEAGLSQMDGAKEFELKFPIHHYFNDHYEEVFDTFSEVKNMAPNCLLKARISINQLASLNDLAKVCTLALESGADGISLYAENFDKDLEMALYVIADIIEKFDSKASTSTILKTSAYTREEALVASSIAIKRRGKHTINNQQFRIGIADINPML